MNQILMTKLSNSKNNKKNFLFLFIFSVLALQLYLAIYLTYKYNLEQEKIVSGNLSTNYQVFKLYAENNTNKKSYNDSDILGTISIPKLNISYPFFFGINDDLLKISPCHFFGEMPYKNSNLCIAGHNYEDDRFFSKISTLEKNDLVIIEDNNNIAYKYYVASIFELNEDDVSSIMKSDNTKKELTLLTCNNKNKKRIIVQCVYKKQK